MAAEAQTASARKAALPHRFMDDASLTESSRQVSHPMMDLSARVRLSKSCATAQSGPRGRTFSARLRSCRSHVPPNPRREFMTRFPLRLTAALAVTAALGLAGAAAAQSPGVTLPPSGGNQRQTVAQQIGLVRVSIDYSSPHVHSPLGDDRKGKIWGQL